MALVEYRMDDLHGYVSEVEVDLSGADLHGLWLFSQLDLADAETSICSERYTERVRIWNGSLSQ